MTGTTAARADNWRATLTAYLTTGTTEAATTTAAPTRRRVTRTATPDDTAARHNRWRATLAAYLGATATEATPEPEPTPARTAAEFLEELLAGVGTAQSRRRTATAPRRTPAPHVQRQRAAAYWQAVQPRADRMQPTTGRPWAPAAA